MDIFRNRYLIKCSFDKKCEARKEIKMEGRLSLIEILDHLSDEVNLLHQEKLKREIRKLFMEQGERAVQYQIALENISNLISKYILEGQNITELVERIAYELSHSGIYDKE